MSIASDIGGSRSVNGALCFECVMERDTALSASLSCLLAWLRGRASSASI